MQDHVGGPIFYPEVYSSTEPNSDNIEQAAIRALSERFGASHASLVMGRIKDLFSTTDSPVVVCAANPKGGFHLAIFRQEGVEQLEIPEPPGYLSDNEIQECLISLIGIISEQVGGVVDWAVCQILCGFAPREDV